MTFVDWNAASGICSVLQARQLPPATLAGRPNPKMTHSMNVVIVPCPQIGAIFSRTSRLRLPLLRGGARAARPRLRLSVAASVCVVVYKHIPTVSIVMRASGSSVGKVG
jgi:hypothetical protein